MLSCPPEPIWRPIPGFEGRYWASDNGLIRGTDGRLRSQQQCRRGYWRVHLSADGRQRTLLVHRLVAAAFLGPCPEGLVVCHGPAGAGCNAIGNLRYASQRDNCGIDKLRDGTHHRGERQGRAQLTAAVVLAIRAMAGRYSQEEIAWAVGTSRANVANIVSRRRWAWL